MLIRLREGSRSRHAVRAPSPGELKGNFLFERSTTLLTAFASRVVSGVRSVAHLATGFDLISPGQIKTRILWGRFGAWLLGSGSGGFSPTGGFIVVLLGSCSGWFIATSSTGGGGSLLLLGFGTGRFSPTPSLGVFSVL